MDTTLDASLRELLARITPLCSHYSTVVQFCEDQAHPATGSGAAAGSGRVNQALAGALYSLIKDYYIFVTQVAYFLMICGHHKPVSSVVVTLVTDFVWISDSERGLS